MSEATRSGLWSTLSRSHLPSLEGQRAVAVIIVMIYHYQIFTHAPADLGVMLFFVLSGFLITRLLLREYERHGSISKKGFYMRRTLRIFPAYYVFLLIDFSIEYVRGFPPPRPLLAASFFYYMDYYCAFHKHQLLDAHLWSLAVEEQFYLLWPAAFTLLVRGRRQYMIPTLAGLIVACSLWRSWIFLHTSLGPDYVYHAFETRMDSLAVGCLVAVLVESRSLVDAFELRLTRWWMPAVGAVFLFLSRRFGSVGYHNTIGLTIDSLVLAAIVLQLITLSAHRAWRWLEHPAVRYVGLISYPLYLYHVRVYGAVLKLHLPTTWLPLAAAFAGSVAMAAASYHLVEKPFLRLKKRWQTEAGPSRHLKGSAPLPT